MHEYTIKAKPRIITSKGINTVFYCPFQAVYVFHVSDKLNQVGEM